MAYGTRIHKDSPLINILRRIYQVSRIVTYFLISTLILTTHLRLELPKSPLGLPVKILTALLPSQDLPNSFRLNHPD